MISLSVVLQDHCIWSWCLF